MESTELLEYFFIVIGICIAFAALREVFTWYWKLNTIVKSLEKLNAIQELLHLQLYVKLDNEITVIHKITKKEQKVTMRSFLKSDMKDKFTIK
jgi:hypothetical protein